MRASTRMLAVAVSVAVAGSALSSCSAESADPPTAFSSADIVNRSEQMRESGNDFAAEVFEDGVVTEQEYLAALRGFSDCLTAYGYSVTDPVLSPLNSLRYSLRAEPGGQNTADFHTRFMSCSELWMMEVESMYMATHEPVMNEALRAAVQSCLRGAGFDTVGNPKSEEEFAAAFDGQDGWRTTYDACLGEALPNLFPDMESF